MMFLIIGSNHSQKQQKEKQTTKEDVKGELLKSTKESYDEYDPNLDEMGEK